MQKHHLCVRPAARARARSQPFPRPQASLSRRRGRRAVRRARARRTRGRRARERRTVTPAPALVHRRSPISPLATLQKRSQFVFLGGCCCWREVRWRRRRARVRLAARDERAVARRTRRPLFAGVQAIRSAKARCPHAELAAVKV